MTVRATGAWSFAEYVACVFISMTPAPSFGAEKSTANSMFPSILHAPYSDHYMKHEMHMPQFDTRPLMERSVIDTGYVVVFQQCSAELRQLGGAQQ